MQVYPDTDQHEGYCFPYCCSLPDRSLIRSVSILKTYLNTLYILDYYSEYGM